ncbi:MAG: ATP-binding protein [Planctomycetota bacterium]
MLTKPRLSIDVPADATWLKSIRGFLTPILQRRFEDDEVQALVLAIDEACANIIKHGQSWMRPRGRILLDVIDKKKLIEFRILNFCGEKDIPKIKPRDLDDVKPGGLGTHFINEIMDSTEFEPDPKVEGRMQLVMSKSIGGKKP